MPNGQDGETILGEQIAYYRARAGEYDEWFLRQGRYDRGTEGNQQWFDEVAQVARALDSFAPTGSVLELACGTGWWTQTLARQAAHLTAVDAAPEVIAINRARLQDHPRVKYVEADALTWEPEGRYDAVFFSFWLSHVPPDRFDAFWDRVAACLTPGGRVFFVDSLYDPASTAADHRLEGREATTLTRRLNDGREFQIVKVFYNPAELADRLAARGWRIEVQTTPHFFLYGSGGRA